MSRPLVVVTDFITPPVTHEDFRFRLIDALSAKPIQPDTLIAESLIPALSTALFQFDGSEGDRLYFDGRPQQGGDYPPKMTLFAPDRSVVRTGSVTTDIDTFTLPSTGSYLVAVEGRFSTTSPPTEFSSCSSRTPARTPLSSVDPTRLPT